jgi:hypothetical protein
LVWLDVIREICRGLLLTVASTGCRLDPLGWWKSRCRHNQIVAAFQCCRIFSICSKALLLLMRMPAMRITVRQRHDELPMNSSGWVQPSPDAVMSERRDIISRHFRQQLGESFRSSKKHFHALSWCRTFVTFVDPAV